MRRFILELGIAYAVGIGDVSSQLTQGLQKERQGSLKHSLQYIKKRRPY
jgi:hypothetical protein